MSSEASRRAFLTASLGALAAPARPKGLLIDTHIHLFEPDRFPYHANATYRPPAQSLADYIRFVKECALDHSVIVHPEPYQDDHSYLEYCFAHEPRPGFFKGTCLFDPVAPATPERMSALVRKLPGRIVALRIHATQDPKRAPTTSGAIRDRDLRAPAMKAAWRAAGKLGLAVQMHFIPFFAPRIGALAAEFRDVPVVLDHLARSGQGTPQQYEDVLRLAKYPRVFMKFSGVRYSSKQEYPYDDARPLVRRVYDAFGAERILWGGLGYNKADFEQNAVLLDRMFDYAPEAARARIRGENARGLYRFGR